MVKMSKSNDLGFLMQDEKTLNEEQRKMLEFFLQNPDVSCQYLVVRNDKPCRLAVHQRLIIKGLWSHQFNLLILTRGGGKTFLLAMYCMIKALLLPREKCVIASSSYRQSQFTFDEVIRFYDESPLIKQSCSKPPTKGPTSCEMHLENGSKIIAYPLGDGQKIRGARANTLVMDEVAQIPEDIISVVIMPMLNTRQDPWDTTGRKNHLVMASSAYFQFNHLYKKYCDYLEYIDSQSEKHDPNYGLHLYTVDDMPDGWMDMAVVNNTRASMTELQYLMEYMCIFPSDSDGFFPAHLMNGAMRPSVLIEPSGERGAKYVFGIDPARTGDNFALVVVRLGNPNKVVACYSLNRKTFPDMHEFIRTKLREYETNGGEVVRIQMDNGGGGLTIKDYLAEEFPWYDAEKAIWKTDSAIIDIDDEDYQYTSGRRILKMQVFSSQSVNSMNYDLRADLEQKRVILPSQPPTEEDDEMIYRRIFDEIHEMVKETMTIVTTPLQNGFHRFDTPKQRMKKDRYSGLLLACQGARELQKDLAGPPIPKLAKGFRGDSFMSNRVV
jgi:hypothetical protein